MENKTGSAVTLEMFSERVGCHFTTASRLRSGERLPGRRLLGRIINTYNLDRNKAFDAFVAGPDEFGAFLRATVFTADDVETEAELAHAS